MTTISIRLGDDEKRVLEEMCADMGMNMTTFYMIYTKKVLRERQIPFEIAALSAPFYSEQNTSQLRKGEFSGMWSRRIDEKARLIYRYENNTLLIAQCKGHYEDR
ncbi:MAG: type II toxin-antitoxin system YoeB family toxin [Oscillospiraceae bacterium]|nr:type II toxin-antitoxin system YoeB family toxin [Oscillospiraceae bacterium]